MSDAIQTDSEMARNEPIEVFSVARDGGKSPEPVKVRALPIEQAEAWMEKANEVEALYKAVEDATKGADRKKLADARKAYNKAVIDCVFSYGDLEARRDELVSVITSSQLARAFALLQLLNDPFVSAGVVQINIQKAVMKGLPMKLLEKQLSGNGNTAS